MHCNAMALLAYLRASICMPSKPIYRVLSGLYSFKVCTLSHVIFIQIQKWTLLERDFSIPAGELGMYSL